MRCLITNDVHLGASRNDYVWLNQAVKLFSCIIDECHRRDIYNLCILGDLFNDRKNLWIKTLDTAIEIANMLKNNNITVYILAGNHDLFHKSGPFISPLQIFKEFDNVQIIEDTKIIDNVGLVSWNKDINLDVEYLFGHFEINNFPVTNNRIFETSHFNERDFSQYKQVLSGHFHIPSQRGNIRYLGAPYHMTFNDVDSLRGFYCFDEGELEFIEFDGIKFVYISSEEIPNEKKIEGNVVRVIFEKDYGTIENNRKIENVQKYNPLRLTTDFSLLSKEISVEEDKVVAQTIKSNKDMLFDFIDIAMDVPVNINKAKMKQIIGTLLED